MQLCRAMLSLAMLSLVAVGMLSIAAAAAEPTSQYPLAPWRKGVSVQPVSSVPGRHTIHSYYLTCPESPDGKQVLFYASATENGELGALYVQDRASGKERPIAQNIQTEDAHRAACQQWTSGGRRIAWHEVRSGQWRVNVADLDTGKIRPLVHDRQIGFGHPEEDRVPVYGCHWNPGPHRGLEFVDVTSGSIQPVFSIDEVYAKYGPRIKERFGEKPVSVFFPIVSPDRRRVFFKLAAGSGGDNFRSKQASQRDGTLVYDLPQQQLIFMRQQWGHPAWHPDSRHIFEVGNLLFDIENSGKVREVPGLPKPSGSHPSVSPDGRLMVTDGRLDKFGGEPGEWGIFVCDLQGGEGRYEIIHRFKNAGGATSWRRNHPHPIFSADGRRIYFNVNDSDWTQLYVAECGKE